MYQKLSAARDGRKARIVWLEDDELLAELGKAIIEEHFSGLEVLWFDNGDAAWRELCEREPDVFITDQLHPGMSGLELLTRLNQKRVRFPIVLSSGPGAVSEVLSFSSINVIPLRKPYNRAALLETLARCLKPFSPPPDAKAG